MNNNDKLKRLIDKQVRRAIFEHKLNRLVENTVNQYLSEAANDVKNPFSEPNKTAANDRTDMKRNSVMAALQNDIIDNAPLAYKLYPSETDSEKATARSLFSKKATGKPDADGQVRHFDDEEINKLFNVLRQRK